MKQSMYLIVSDDSLKTAFYCGTAGECSELLGVTKQTFYSMFCKGMRFMRFFRVEKVEVEE